MIKYTDGTIGIKNLRKWKATNSHFWKNKELIGTLYFREGVKLQQIPDGSQ